MMRFWFDKGIDGFRMGVIPFISKDTTCPPLPAKYHGDYFTYYANGPQLHNYLQEMNREVLSKYDVMSVAEGAGRNPQEAMQFVDPAQKELNMTYHFDAGRVMAENGTYKLTNFKNVFTSWEKEFATKGWQSIYLGSHAQARIVSRFGDDRPEFRAAAAKLLTTFLLTMHGTPYCYYGDELGMTNSHFPRLADYRDVAARNGYQLVKNQQGDTAAYLKSLACFSRDNGRTPLVEYYGSCRL